jgi:hypothetical protein
MEAGECQDSGLAGHLQLTIKLEIRSLRFGSAVAKELWLTMRDDASRQFSRLVEIEKKGSQILGPR